MLPGTLGVSCRTLGDGPPVMSLNATQQFPTASTIKVLIMTTAFTLEEQNPGTLDELVTTHRGDLIGGSEYMARQPDGKKIRVRDLIVPMIRLSDNTASNALIGHFGVDVINTVGAGAGMTQTHLARKFLDYSAIVRHQDNLTTPEDMALLLYQIARGAREGVNTVVSPEHCRRMIAIMLGQTDRDGIPAALPPRTQVANKTGEIDGTRNDVAIVEPFADSPYILSVFTKRVTNYDAAYHAIHSVTRLANGVVGHSGL
jgi:beta-lactamase class A